MGNWQNRLSRDSYEKLHWMIKSVRRPGISKAAERPVKATKAEGSFQGGAKRGEGEGGSRRIGEKRKYASNGSRRQNRTNTVEITNAQEDNARTQSIAKKKIIQFPLQA